MKTIQEFTDKFSIGLSLLCAIHCLALPLLLLALPSLSAFSLDHEAFHTWMLVAVIPTSIYALTIGCKKHKRYRLLFTGSIGLLFLLLAVVLGHDVVGESGEKILTVIGTVFIFFAHLSNFRLCQRHNNCSCDCK